jgi:CHRD domain-containing protein
MKSRSLSTLAAAGAMLCLVALPLSSDAGDNKHHFKADLNGFNEVPANSTDGTGSLSLDISQDDSTIDFTLSYENLTTSPVVAHIHLGRSRTNGGVSVFFCGGGGKPPCPPQPATVTGTIVAANVLGPTGQGIDPGELAELIRAIRAGATYANAHTAKFPGGEIRGQIRRHGDD